MSAAKTSVLHILQEDDFSSLLPCPPLLSSGKLNWNKLNTLVLNSPPGETPYASGPLHNIILHFPHNQCMMTERFLDGKTQREEVHHGDVVVIPAHTIGRTVWDADNDSIMMLLDPTFVAHVAYEQIDPDHVEIAPQFATPDPTIQQIGLQIKTELENPQIGNRLYIDSLATLLAVCLLRNYSTRKPQIQRSLGSLSKQQLMRTLTYINDNLSEDLSLGAIASQLNMSQSHFGTLFKGATGVSVYKYVIQRRMEIAKRLLARSKLSIVDVSLQVGFQSQNHFHNVFRRYTGVTPRSYRTSFQ
jgi:AraC family transcriptional regulator